MRIQYEDDLVIVKDAETNEVYYKGLEDYEELKREDWKWNDKEKHYELEKHNHKLIKIKVA